LKILRENLYLIFSLNYNLDDFLTSLTQFIIKLLNDNNEKISNIIDYILKANIRINTCKKSVIHLETMTLKIIRELCRWIIFKLFNIDHVKIEIINIYM